MGRADDQDHQQPEPEHRRDQGSQGRRLNRRTFLAMIGAGTVGAASLLAACTSAPPASPTTAPAKPADAAKPTEAPKPADAAKPTEAPRPAGAAPTSASAPALTTAPAAKPADAARPAAAAPASTSVAAVAAGKLKLPAYVPFTSGPAPDLAPTDDGVQAGFYTFPKNLVKTVPNPPGSGGTITALTNLPFPPPPPLDQNPAWQAIHKELNAKIDLKMVPSADYLSALATTMAGGDIPDLLYMPLIGPTAADLPQFLKAACADLTPHLSGDAIKEYPNLAQIPTASWLPTVFDGSIFAIPVPRTKINYVWYANKTWMDELKLTPPKNGDDFKRILKEMTRPNEGKWGLGQGAPDYGLQTGRGDAPQLAMFGVPNNWAVDANGTFTKDVETEQFKAAVAYVRELYQMGVFFPEKLPLNAPPFRTNMVGNKLGMISTGWISYATQLWEPGLKSTPPVVPRTFAPFSADGSKPIWHQFYGAIGMTVIKKGPEARVKEILRILNYLAAPFGSQEALLLEYGVEGTDFNFDASGTPVRTEKGNVDVNVMWQYLTVRLPVLYNAAVPDYAKVAHADATAMIGSLIQDPTVGLYSPTDRAKGGLLLRQLSDGLGPIVAGTAPLSDLDKVVNDWKSGGGESMRTEYARAYADFMK
jgi:putative aldouronate transport system substrate-binding protein